MQPRNPEYVKLSHVFQSFMHRELSTLLGAQVSGLPMEITHGEEINLNFDESYFLLKLFDQDYEDSIYFFLKESFAAKIVEILSYNKKVSNYSRYKPINEAILEEAGYKIFGKSYKLCALLINRDIELDLVQVKHINFIQLFEKTLNNIPLKKYFTVTHSIEIAPSITTVLYQLIPKTLIRKGAVCLGETNDISIRNNDAHKCDLDKFLKLYKSLQMPFAIITDAEDMPENKHKTGIEIVSQKADFSSDTTLPQKIYEGILSDIDNISTKIYPEKCDKSISIENMEYFFIAKLFSSIISEKRLKKLINLDVEVEPQKISSVSTDYIHKESSGFLARVYYNGNIKNKTAFVFNPDDTRRLVRGDIESFEQILEELIQPSAKMLSKLFGQSIKITNVESKYVLFAKTQSEASELSIRIDYRLKIKNRESIYYRQYLPVTFLNRIINILFDQDRIAEIVSDSRKLLTSILDINDEISSIAENDIQLRKTLNIKKEDTGVEFEDDSIDFETGETINEPPFVVEPKEWVTLASRDIRIFMQEILKVKGGKKNLAHALFELADEFLKKITKNISRIVAEDILYLLESESINMDMQLEACVSLTEILMNLSGSNKIRLSGRLKSLVLLEQIRKKQQEQYQIGILLHGYEFPDTVERISNIDLQRVLRLVTYKELLFSFAFADSEVREKLKENMTSKQKKWLDEDIESVSNLEKNENTLHKKAAFAIKKIIRIANDITKNEVSKIFHDHWDTALFYYIRRSYQKAIYECEGAIAFGRKNNIKIPYYFYLLPVWLWSVNNIRLERGEKFLESAFKTAKTDWDISLIHLHCAVNALARDCPGEARTHMIKCGEYFTRWPWIEKLTKHIDSLIQSRKNKK